MALSTALSGINAAQADLGVIANNISNANTVGFKGSRAQFSDIFAVTGSNLNSTATGSGAHLDSVAQQFSQGAITSTNNSMDMAISGNGFFITNTGTGIAYTRAGNFQVDANNNVVTPSGAFLQIYPPNGAGGFDTSTLSNLQLTSVQSNATATSQIGMTANLPATATVPVNPFSPTDATSYNAAVPVTVYDSQGGSHQGTVYYAKTGINSWNANLYVDGNSAGTNALTFDVNGNLLTPAGGNMTFTPLNLGNGSAPLALTVNVSNTTQFGTAYSPGTITQNGFAAGNFSSIDVSSSGVVTANYSNNQAVKLGQVALANFNNVQGLSQLGNSSWAASGDSGIPQMGVAGTGQFGAVQSSALESSNTADTTAQLVNMIQAQRDYQANAQVLGTDSVLTNALFQAVSR